MIKFDFSLEDHEAKDLMNLLSKELNKTKNKLEELRARDRTPDNAILIKSLKTQLRHWLNIHDKMIS